MALGIILLDWEIFEVALTYLLETGISFFIAMLRHYFVNKDTKESLLIAIFNIIFFSMSLLGILALLAGIIHYLTGPKLEKVQDAFLSMPERINESEISFILISIGIVHIIVFILQKILVKKVIKVSLWANLEKIFYINAFIGICTLIYGFLPHNSTIGLFLFVIAKFLVDFFLELSEGKKKKRNDVKN